jgi:hypothetical protein
MATVGNLFINVRAKTEGLQKGLNKARSSIRTFTKRIFSLKSAMIGLGAALAGSAVFKMITKITESIDLVTKTSAKLGMTTEALQKLRFAGQMAGVGVTTIDMALQRFIRRVAEAAMGTGEAKAALIELGLDAKELSQIPVDKAMERVADSMKDVSTDADRVRLAFKLFDSEGVSMINMLRDGSEALAETGKDFDSLNATITEFDSIASVAFSDSRLRMSTAFQGLVKEIAATFLPLFTWLINEGANVVASFGTNLRLMILDLIKSVMSAVGFIGDAFDSLIFGWHSFRVSWFEGAQGFLYDMQQQALAVNNILQSAVDVVIKQGQYMEKKGAFKTGWSWIVDTALKAGNQGTQNIGRLLQVGGAMGTAKLGMNKAMTKAGIDPLIDGLGVALGDAQADLAKVAGSESMSSLMKKQMTGLDKFLGDLGFFDAIVAQAKPSMLQLPELTAVESVIDAIAGGDLIGDGVDKSIKRVKGKTGTIQTALGSATVGPTVNLLKQVVDELKKQTRMSKDMKRAAETPDYGYDTGNAFT